MTNPVLSLEGVSYVLPDGRTLFSDLSEQFDQRHTGLVGRNGAGKSVLAGILAGSLQASTGRIISSGSVHYLPQQVAPPAHLTVAGLAGVHEAVAALARIEAGSCAPADFDAVSDRWDVRQQLRHELERNGLGHLDATTPADTLSGGEAMRVALIGAMLSNADFLILDEPSNHLDRPNRQALLAQLQDWPRGLLVISHDRQLLDSMERMMELSSLGLLSYGGNYSFYACCKAQERQNAIEQLAQCKLERQREEQSMHEQRERQERRQARGNRQGQAANQAKILLGRQKERCENASGKLRQRHNAAREQLAERVHNAARCLEAQAPIALLAQPTSQAAQRRVAELEGVVLPCVGAATRTISLTLTGQQRLGVVGANGCGKSTLLKVLSGQLQPRAGICKVTAASVYLDQQLSDLAPQTSLLAQLLAANRTAGEGQLRMQLAQLGLDAAKIVVPSAALSGGERLKAALACALYANTPAQLLLLDEPSNHLDLPSLQALETMLRSYQGALLVVSHDDTFLNNLGLTERLLASEQGWRLEPW